MHQFQRIRETLVFLPQAVSVEKAKYQDVPLLGSPAASEYSAFAGEETVRTLYTQATLLLDSAGDHMAALERVLTEPVMTVAPWTISRSILESASLAMWLLEVDLHAPDRVARGITLRLHDLHEQLILARTASGLQLTIPQIEQRIKGVISQGQGYGLPEKRNRNGELLSFGESVPNGAQLAKRAFDAETIYRLLSSAEHNRTWAILQLSTLLAERNLLEPHLPTEGAFGLIISSVQWYARLIWNWFQLYGWDLNSLSEILEFQYNQAGINEKGKFWLKG